MKTLDLVRLAGIGMIGGLTLMRWAVTDNTPAHPAEERLNFESRLYPFAPVSPAVPFWMTATRHESRAVSFHVQKSSGHQTTVSSPKAQVEKMLVSETVASPSRQDAAEKPGNTYVPLYIATTHKESGSDSYSYMLLYEKAEQMRMYAERHGYNTQYAFLINLGMRSGKKRFFVMDLVSMTIVQTGLVAHGRGDSRFTFDKSYSNQAGSNCSSLGIYRLGGFYNGTFGPSYRLTGLQNSNSRAAERGIVLHPMNCIPYEESDYAICQSEGCPSVSPKFFEELRTIVDAQRKPILLCIYDPAEEKDL